jgi:putative aldouronate transport system substrate-binding protein
MKRSKSKWISLGLVAILSLSMLAGCTKSSDSSASPAATTAATAAAETKKPDAALKPLKITFFDKNTGDAFTNTVALEITKRTGVTIEIQQPSGNPSEKLNLMLASNDLPDLVLMDRGSDIVNKYIAAGALMPLNDMIDKLGPNVKKMYGDTLTKTRYTDGKNYYLSNWYSLDPEPVFSFLMRMDLMKELGAGSKVNDGTPFTTEEFTSLLKKFKEKYPTVDGKPSLPLTMNGENMGAIQGTFKGMFGMKSYYEVGGELKRDVRDPKYLEMIKYINSLYTQGLVDKEWAINKNQLVEQKLSSGTVFATVGAYWDLGGPNNLLKEAAKDPAAKDERQFYPYKVVAPGIDPAKTTFGPRSSLGWDAIAITKANKDPERTMKLIDFLVSEEGQYLLMWGVEGVHWDMKDGKHVPRPDVLKGFKDNWNEYAKSTGIRKWTWFIKNGSGKDGTPYDVVTKFDKDPVAKMATKNLSDTVWDTSPYDNLGPAGGTPDALVQQKVDDITKNYFPKMILSASNDKAVELYNAMMKELNAAGLDKLEKIYTDNYKKRLELWK